MTPAPLSPVGPTPELIALQRVVAGRYSIVRELGRGGMGIVFLARDVALERPVAIKLLPPALALNVEHRARFVREARAAARLSHPNIVPIHSVEEHADLAFFVMGFVDGETLSARVARVGPLNVTDAIRLTQEIAWALAHAHGHTVVHRDVKPDNILLERDTGRAIVTDFGIARVDGGPSASNPGAIIGTPRYMSPEQANGEAVDGRSDLYSLGAVAYFATTGRAPIDGDSAAAILARKLLVTPTPLAEVRSDVPPRFAAAVDRCLARDPAERWPIGRRTRGRDSFGGRRKPDRRAGSSVRARSRPRWVGGRERDRRVDHLDHSGRRRDRHAAPAGQPVRHVVRDRDVSGRHVFDGRAGRRPRSCSCSRARDAFS